MTHARNDWGGAAAEAGAKEEIRRMHHRWLLAVQRTVAVLGVPAVLDAKAAIAAVTAGVGRNGDGYDGFIYPEERH